jgi:hypothetical protein
MQKEIILSGAPNNVNILWNSMREPTVHIQNLYIHVHCILYKCPFPFVFATTKVSPIWSSAQFSRLIV